MWEGQRERCMDKLVISMLSYLKRSLTDAYQCNYDVSDYIHVHFRGLMLYMQESNCQALEALFTYHGEVLLPHWYVSA